MNKEDKGIKNLKALQMSNYYQTLKNLKSKANSLERQLEACKWTNTEQYKELIDIEQQIEKLKDEMGKVYGMV